MTWAGGHFQKRADASLDAASEVPPAASPLPDMTIRSSAAPGRRGPAGMAPRQSYSKVHTSAPMAADAGASEQKSLPPQGANMLPKTAAFAGESPMGKMAGRPMLQDLVKAAMVESAERVRISEEARFQREKIAEEKCAGCQKMKSKCACMGMKAASAPSHFQHVEKLAGALDFIAVSLVKAAGDVPPEASAATSATALSEDMGEGVHTVPMHPTQQKGLPKEQTPTQMANNLGKAASVVDLIRFKLAADEHEKEETEGLNKAKKGLDEARKAHFSEPENQGEKRAAGFLADIKNVPQNFKKMRELRDTMKDDLRSGFENPFLAEDLKDAKKNFAKGVGKAGLAVVGTAGAAYGAKKLYDRHRASKANAAMGNEERHPEKSASLDLASYMSFRVKQAEDAINPAQISAGPAVPPDTSASEEAGGAPAGGAPRGNTGLVGSNEAAREYKRRQAYSGRKEELSQFFAEPALSAEHDKALQVAFDNTANAGPKIASAAPSQSVKTAAARVLLSKLAAGVETEA